MDKKCYRWGSLSWAKTVLMTGTQAFPWTNWWTQRKQIAKYIHEDQKSCRICMPADKGKITDAGYDNLSCICAKINSRFDFTVEADITVDQFLYEPGPNNQEGFGLFLRETIKRHPSVGVYYSNMAAVGGYYGRFNFFGRSGILQSDISHIDNFVLYHQVNWPKGAYEHDPLHYRISGDQHSSFHLTLCKQGKEVSVKMTGMDGTDILAPKENGGLGELSGMIPLAGKLSRYAINMGNAFCSYPGRPVYIGFFSTRGTEITIHKESFRLTVIGKEKLLLPGRAARPAAREGDVFPQKPFDAEDYASVIQQVYYVSPDGKPSGDGSEKWPLDIDTAIKRCGYNGQIVLKAGRYNLSRSIVIGKEHSGKPGRRKQMTGSPDGGTVIDYGDTEGKLSILGDYWVVENIHVTNGYGIQIEGSYNWLRRCSSFRNYETGILIRHHDNSSDRRNWPCHNMIEDCCSYENRDAAECNADGFACKVASGIGNVFMNCISFLNSDDGFDLFTKNRVTGAVTVSNCRSYLNGFKLNQENKLESSRGNGNGFKLGGSGMRVDHAVVHCVAEGNRQYGFTNNSNPYMFLVECRSMNNMRKNIHYGVYGGSRLKRVFRTKKCITNNKEDFNPDLFLDDLLKVLVETGITIINRNG